MEAAIVGGLLKITLPKLWSMLHEKLKLLKGGLEADVESIQSELKFIEAAIKDYRSSGKHTSHVRKIWIEELRPLAYDIEDCIERFLRRVMSQGVLVAAASSQQFAGEMRKLKERSEGIHKLLATYNNISTSSDSDCASSSTARAPVSSAPPLPAAGRLVGMTVPLDELRDLLLREPGSASERKRKVISIVGFGGLGKTLLAQQVYNDKSVRNHFPLHAWVHAAGNDAQEILKEILDKVLLSREKELKQVHPLTGLLKPTRYLIVIDDLRTTRQWDTILSAFPGEEDEVDSRIIVTTTIRSVANHCSSGNGRVYKMGALGDEDSKKLFFRTTDPHGRASPSPAMELDSAALLKTCDGLPLALVSTAQFLQSNGGLTRRRCVEACLRLCAPEKCDDGALERMRGVLVGSYESLCSTVLQQCLLYFCIFPPDHHVRKNPLIRRWVAEGLVQHPRDAVQNLEALIDRNIVQPIQLSNNESVKRCRPPGMMLEYISSRSMSENFITTVFGREIETAVQQQHVRRLCLHHIPTSEADLPKDLSRLRTLAVFNSTTKQGDDATANLANKNEADLNFFKCCLLLRVLDLEEFDGLNNKDFRGICSLLPLLKYLSLGAGISKVPAEIENLEWLETLDLRRTKIETVPIQVIKLPQLRHLLGKFRHFRGDSGKRKLQKFLSEKGNLETLSGFVTGESQDFPKLMLHMKRLRKVKIWCDDSNAAGGSNLAPVSEAITEFIRVGNHRPDEESCLSIDFQECSHPERLLNSVRAPGRLTSLKLRCKLSRFPQFVTQLSGIEELCLSSTALRGDLVLSGLCQLRVLKYLKLVEDDIGPLIIGPQYFPSLKRICLVAAQSLQPIIILPQALPYLASLHIICRALDGLSGIEIGCLGGLREVALDSRVAPGTRDEWRAAARGHPNKPEVLLIQGP